MEQAQQPASVTLADVWSELQRLRRQTDDLWSADEIADYVRRDRKTVLNHYVKRPDFPAPCQLSGRNRLWASKEVRAWALKQR